jgi:DNA invertase Pin-like site-specific DNA recombinase
MLATLLRNIAAGRTLVVVWRDRLTRSVSHLLAVNEQLEASGAHFRSLRTSTSLGSDGGRLATWGCPLLRL